MAPTAPQKKGRIHRAWIMLAACILFQGGTTGILYNCLGVFYTAICTDLGFRNGDISMYSTLRSLTTALAMPFTMKLLKRYPLKLVLSVELTVVAVLYGSMGFFHHLIWWYVTAIIMGIFGSSLFAVPVTLVINNWFKKKNGFAVGLSLAASGLFGAVLNPICSSIITALGWRPAAFIMAGLSLVTVLPMTLFVMRLTPQEVGMQPYGAEDPETLQEIKKNVPQGTVHYAHPGLVLGLCIVICAVAMWTCQYYSHMARYAQSIGYDLSVSALVSSCAMIGNIIGKVALGAIADKWNIWSTSRLAMGVVGISFIILIIGGDSINVYVMYVTAIMQGVSMAAATIIPNLMSLDVYKAEGYQEKYGLITAAGTLVGAFAFSIIGYTFDFTGSYNLSFIISVISVGIFFVANIWLNGIVKKEQRTAQ